MARDVLDQIYNLYVRPHLDYGDITYRKYDPEFKLDFTKRLESTQYSGALAVSGAWRGTNTDKIYEELGWEILYYRRWYRRLCHFSKLQNDQRPLYLYNDTTQELLSVTIYEDQTCLNHLQKALTDLPIFISKIVLENGTD